MTEYEPIAYIDQPMIRKVWLQLLEKEFLGKGFKEKESSNDTPSYGENRVWLVRDKI